MSPITISAADSLSSSSPFLRFWGTDRVRDCFLSQLSPHDLASLRLTCEDFSSRATPFLFASLDVTFGASTFSKPARMAALERIGAHVQNFTFRMPHSPETFLPPLLDPASGEEVEWSYEPNVQAAPSAGSSPTYGGNWELTDLLVKQYPPIFHAAANVASFTRVFISMTSLKHLSISCPGQDPALRYRRSAVDIALISLRIAVERASLSALHALSLLDVHSAAPLYLNPKFGFGARPGSARCWARIKELTVRMSVPPEGSVGHLKQLHAYLSIFTPACEKLVFSWDARNSETIGPSGSEKDSPTGVFPLAIPASIGSELPTSRHKRNHLVFPRLSFLQVDSVQTSAATIASFILAHKRTISEFSFDRTELGENESWDEALAPLTKMSGNEDWKRPKDVAPSLGTPRPATGIEVMDCPIMYTPEESPSPQGEHATPGEPSDYFSPAESTPRPDARVDDLEHELERERERWRGCAAALTRSSSNSSSSSMASRPSTSDSASTSTTLTTATSISTLSHSHLPRGSGKISPTSTQKDLPATPSVTIPLAMLDPAITAAVAGQHKAPAAASSTTVATLTRKPGKMSSSSSLIPRPEVEESDERDLDSPAVKAASSTCCLHDFYAQHHRMDMASFGLRPSRLMRLRLGLRHGAAESAFMLVGGGGGGRRGFDVEGRHLGAAAGIGGDNLKIGRSFLPDNVRRMILRSVVGRR